MKFELRKAKIDLSKACTRASQYETISGLSGDYEGDQECSTWFEMYQVTFLDDLERYGYSSDAELALILEEVIDYPYVGDALDHPKPGGIAAFGLILLDRIVATDWGRKGGGTCFHLHEHMYECFEHVLQVNQRSREASALARRRHAKSYEAKRFVVSEWAKFGVDYKFNKAEFARHYVRRVKHEFDVDIKEKQLKEVWLRDTPPARKPAVLPAGG